MNVRMFDRVGSFAGNKDVARDVRRTCIIPSLERGEEVTIDFDGVSGATQSFIHALLSEVIRTFGVNVLDRIVFKACNENVRAMIVIVTEYMQVGLEGEEQE